MSGGERSSGLSWLPIFLLAAVTPVYAADLSPADQLGRMAQSLRSLDYEGSFLYQNGGRLDTLRIFHVGGGSERERLISLSGPRSEAVRVGDVITSVKAGGLSASYNAGNTARLLPLLPSDAASITGASYSLRAGGVDRVAGYDAQIVDVVAADQYRYGYRLWLERGNQFPLRVAVLSGDQRLVEQFMFLMLSIGKSPESVDLQLSDRAAPIVAMEPAVELTGQARWAVGDLPSGFRLTGRHAGPAPGNGAEQLIFGDGLATVSAYVEPTPDPIEDDVSLARGAMSVYIHRDGAWRYTVLGNVPGATVQRIALSLAPIADPSSQPR